jgi:hypothetical protein
MSMTHYMQLLAENQPWNLIIFMAIPVIFAEYITITGLYVLFTRNFNGVVRKSSRIAGIIVGVYFVGVFLYLLTNAVIPLTTSGGWRGPADVIAVSFYLLGVIPLAGIALLEAGLLKRKASELERLKVHTAFVGVFLVVAHIAMIFGMLNPDLLG